MKRFVTAAMMAAGSVLAAEPKTGEEIAAVPRPAVDVPALPKEGLFIGSGVYGAYGSNGNTGWCFTNYRPPTPKPAETPRLCAEERTGNTLQFWFETTKPEIVADARRRGLYTTCIYSDYFKPEQVKAVRDAAGDTWLGLDYGEKFTFRMEAEEKDKARGATDLKSLADDLVARVHAHVKKMRANGWGAVMATGGYFYFDYDVFAGTEIPLVEDYPFINMHRSSSLARGLSRQYALPFWGSHLAHDWYSYYPRTNPYKMTSLDWSLKLKYLDGAKMLVNESGNWAPQGSFAPDEPMHLMPKTRDRRLSGLDPDERRRQLAEANALASNKWANVDYRSPVATKYRKILRAFTDFCGAHPAPLGQPEATVAIAKGNFDLWGGDPVHGYAIGNAYDLAEKDPQWYFGDPERSWTMLMDLVWPLPKEITWPNGNYLFGGTPYGQIDTVSFAYDNVSAEHLLRNYKALVFCGWNTCSEKQYRVLCDYVKGGGRLVISLPHLSTDRARHWANFRHADLVNGGDFSDLMGLRVTGRGARFYWATGYEREKNCLGLYMPRRWGIMSQPLGELEFTGPKEDYELLAVDDERMRPVIVRAKKGKGEVFFVNTWCYPYALQCDFGAGNDVRGKGLMGELYAYVMRTSRGNVFITGPDFETPDRDCDFISYSYFPDAGTICLMNMDPANERKCVLHWFGEKDFITLKPGEFRHIAAPKLDPEEKLNANAFIGSGKGQLPGFVKAEGDVTGRLEIRTEGFADVAAGRAMAPNTLFWIASNTKGVAAATFLSLADEGRIALDDPVEKYLPEWMSCTVKATGRAPKRKPTFRMMLSHTAGLPFFVLNPGGKSCTIDRRTVRELSRLGAATPLSFEPGENYDYSNWGIDVAMAAVEVVTGRPFEEEMKRRVLDPLGMSDTCFIPSEEQMTRLAKSYRLTDERVPEEVVVCQFTAPYTAATRRAEAGGGLFSTATDLAKFFRMIAANGRKPDGSRLLSAKAMDEWFTRQTPAGNPNAYSFGMCVGRDKLSHGGSYGTAGFADRARGTYLLWLVSVEGGNTGSRSARSANVL